jgi:3'-phosphoadenosine 5'-phosphosulfate sulfotransferase (PAPS reductase)/FAD synthetase
LNAQFTKKDLVKMTNEPYERQYQRILAKIMEAVSWTKGDMVVCFSGGKDSALMLDMYCEVIQMFGLAHIPIKVAWANTTNETTAMKQYIPYFIKRCEKKYGVKIELEEVTPANKQTIITVMKDEGLPFISKMVSSTLRKVTKDMENNGVTYDNVKDLHKPTVQCRDALRKMGLSNTTVLAFTGWSCSIEDFGTGFVLAQQWMPLLDIKRATGENIRFSEKCCNILKKEPISRLNYPNVMLGEQAVESKNRESAWLKTGCNYKFPDGTIRSKPLGSVSLDAILYSIAYRDIPLCSDYGSIEQYTDRDKVCYRCTKAQRTGCALCGFGIKYDPERFARLLETEPAKVAFAFKPISQGGLGYKEVCEYMNEYCKTKIVIPNV